MKYLRLLFLLSVWSLNAQTNWHISMSGSDTTGDGSLNNPFANLRRLHNLQAGDTVFVHQGTYYNSDFNDGDIWDGDNLFTLTANGNPNNYIVIMPYPGDQVTLKSDARYNILVNNSSYIKIIGFELEGIANDITQTMADNAWGLYKDSNGNIHDLAVELGIDINDPSLRGTVISKPVLQNIHKPDYYVGHGLICRNSHHIVFKDNKIHDFPGSGLRADKSDYVEIIQNEIYHNTYWTTAGVGALTIAASKDLPTNDTFSGVKTKILKNNVHDNENRLISWNPGKNFISMVIDEGSGIFLTRNADTYHNGYILIANNLSVKNGASGIVIHKTDRVVVEFNSTYYNGTTNDGKPGGITFNSVNTATIRNNIAYARPDHYAMGKNGGSITGVTITNNIIYNENGNEPVYHNIPNSGFVITNPLFTNPANNQFTLQANSPAIDTAVTSNYTNDDFTSALRDANPDIGAYEFFATSIDEMSDYTYKLYPNPASNYVRLEGDFRNGQEIEIFGMNGKLIFSVKTFANSHQIILPLKMLNSGLYILKIGSYKQVIIKK